MDVLQKNHLKVKLDRGDLVLGSGVESDRSLGIVNVMAASDADFIFIDLEHQPHSLETTANLIQHALGLNVSPMVRIGELSYSTVGRILDSGCQDLMLAHMQSPDQLEQLVELAKYPPVGRRGICMRGTLAHYREVTDIAAAAEWGNANVQLGLTIETAGAMENLDALLSEYIDYVIVGYVDLSAEYGIIGQYDHPLIKEAQVAVRDLCKERGIAYMAAVGSQDKIQGAVDFGAQMILYGGAYSLLCTELTGATSVLRQSVRR